MCISPTRKISPSSTSPFYTDDYIFDVEKKDSIKTLLLTLWKSEDDKVTKTESGEPGQCRECLY